MSKKKDTKLAADASAENGKKGGRPKSEATIRTQAARDYISLQVADSLSEIVEKAITQAIEGDYKAREWLSNRAWGKPLESIDHTTNGESMPSPIYGGLSKPKDE